MKSVLFIMLLFLSLVAQDKYSMRVAYGQATTKDLGEILIFDMDTHPDNLSVLALDAGYLLVGNMWELPVELYAKGGFGYFKDDTNKHILKNATGHTVYLGNKRDNVYEGTIYVKLYYSLDFWQNRVRFGLGEGLSYTTRVLWTEQDEAIRENEDYSKFLNYLDISVDFDLGKLVGYEPLKDTYIGWTIKHRSGVFGLFNGVHGGSNYNTLSIEKIF